jgi:hypothetical protein
MKKNEKRVTDNLNLNERKTLKEFRRNTPVSERNLIACIKDESNNFVF